MLKVQRTLERSRTIPSATKKKIIPLLRNDSMYSNKMIFGLKIPKELKSIKLGKGDCFSLGADKNGFFVYTHRARSKSYKLYTNIPTRDVKFIGSTA